ncbi:hypothetical protein H8S95_09580 [Pontibacter sp. KCTC 32443]|uniref:hypothetical protein n=1 Tax=Pontibacter TaxID=323449 RepID=UPI00164DF182|nr:MULTISPECIES: hypothetical protein [Pontibacter]MBC5774310.1 hypothetical protein [Pontibacter sp. KCTC 32443]
MKLLLLILSLLISCSAFGQLTETQSYWKSIRDKDVKELGMAKLDTAEYQKAYRIWRDYQVVELVQYNDSTYDGQIVNFATKHFGSKRKPKSELLVHKIKIPGQKVLSLMDTLKAFNIETLPDSEEIQNYPQGLDGTTYVFEIGKNEVYRLYSYWEPESERYQDGSLPEIISVRKILESLDKEFTLNKFFAGFLGRLPKGEYSYGGIYMIKN